LEAKDGVARSVGAWGVRNASARTWFPGAGLPERSRARLSAGEDGRPGREVQDLYF
jgi:hypothetical protein